MSATEKQTRHVILMTALDLHHAVEELGPPEWSALEKAVPGPLAQKVRLLSDAVFADQQRRARRR